jgi:hypothetical protein
MYFVLYPKAYRVIAYIAHVQEAVPGMCYVCFNDMTRAVYGEEIRGDSMQEVIRS